MFPKFKSPRQNSLLNLKFLHLITYQGLPWKLSGKKKKKMPAIVEDMSSIPRLGRSTGEGNGNPLQYSCLGTPMDRGGWWTIIHRVA